MKSTTRKQKPTSKSSYVKIAQQAGVSTATVSRVMNNSPKVDPNTRISVLRVLNEFQKTLSPGSESLPVVGVSIADFHRNRLVNHFDRDCLAGLMEGAVLNNLQILPQDILAQKRPNESYTELVMRYKLNGLIHIGPHLSAFPAIEEIADAGFPQVLIGARVRHPQVSWLDSENIESTCKAIRYLCNLGHRRIAIMFGAINAIAHAKRVEGYRKALSEYGIEEDGRLEISRLHIDPESGVSATIELLSIPNPPTAIFYANGELAIGGVQACRKMGVSIPRDISIISFDDSKMSEYLTPPLTYIRQPVFEMGRKAVQIISTKLKNSDSSVLQEEIMPDFLVNESTAPVPQR